MSVTATVENNTIRLPEGVQFPDGAVVRVELLQSLPSAPVEAWLERAQGAALPGVTTAEIMRLMRG